MRKNKKHIGAYISEELYQAFKNHAETVGLTNTELIEELIRSGVVNFDFASFKAGEHVTDSPRRNLSLQEFASTYNEIFFDEDDKQKEVVVELILKSEGREIWVPSIMIKSNTKLDSIFHSYAKFLKDTSSEQESAKSKKVVESQRIEYGDVIYLYKKYGDDSVDLQLPNGQLVDRESELYKNLTKIYEESSSS